MTHGYNPNRDKDGKFANGPVAAPSAAAPNTGGNVGVMEKPAPDYEGMAEKVARPIPDEWEDRMVLDGENVGDYQVLVVTEEDPYNPREEDENFSTMVMSHRRYALGDDNHGLDTDCSLDELIEQAEDADGMGIQTVYLYDHSGQSLSWNPAEDGVHLPDRWDSGVVGIAYTTPEQLKEAGLEVNEENARKLVGQELSTYNSYIRGDVMGFAIVDKEGELVEYAGNYFPDESGTAGVLAEAKWEVPSN